jgi:hypothetical protein
MATQLAPNMMSTGVKRAQVVVGLEVGREHTSDHTRAPEMPARRAQRPSSLPAPPATRRRRHTTRRLPPAGPVGCSGGT